MTRQTQNRELLVLKHFIHRRLSKEHCRTLAEQDADISLNYCNIEDITAKPSTQLKSAVLILNPNGEVNVRKMFDNTTQAN